MAKRAKTTKKRAKLGKITSLYELFYRATEDSNYLKLLKIASVNLGGPSIDADVTKHKRWLNTNALETSEEGVVDEINFVRDLV